MSGNQQTIFDPESPTHQRELASLGIQSSEKKINSGEYGTVETE